MYKNAKESLVEIVIGDAILELLEADAPISHEALLILLTRHLESETRETRREALSAAIKEVSSSHFLSMGERKAATQWESGKKRGPENILKYLNSDPPGQGDKKH